MAIFLGIGAIVCAHWVMFYTSIKLGNIPRQDRSATPLTASSSPHTYILPTHHKPLQSLCVCLSISVYLSLSLSSICLWSVYLCLSLSDASSSFSQATPPPSLWRAAAPCPSSLPSANLFCCDSPSLSGTWLWASSCWRASSSYTCRYPPPPRRRGGGELCTTRPQCSQVRPYAV